MHKKTRFHKFIINELLSSLGGAASYRMKPDLLCFKKFPVSVCAIFLVVFVTEKELLCDFSQNTCQVSSPSSDSSFSVTAVVLK